MTKNEARNYVMTHALFSTDSPRKPYFVRFPTSHGSKLFTSKDTADLVEQLFAFGRTVRGRQLWSIIPKGKYKEAPLEIEEDED